MFNTELLGRLLTWATGQPASTVLLLLQLVAIVAGGRHIIDVALPSYLAAVQAGYDRQEAEQSRQLERVIAAAREDRQVYQELIGRLNGHTAKTP